MEGVQKTIKESYIDAVERVRNKVAADMRVNGTFVLLTLGLDVGSIPSP